MKSFRTFTSDSNPSGGCIDESSATIPQFKIIEFLRMLHGREQCNGKCERGRKASSRSCQAS